ncbi:MAG: hydrogenase maturation protease [Candidatus Aenigmarchaeota archaeon]|nr:hydrogenase maturation protease [Candidatus Aenigmarchaeota archaeon]
MKAVMSIGNPIKSDDNIGNIILDKLDVKDIIKIKAWVTPENFIKNLKDYDEIIILDALKFGGKIGEVKIFELNEIKDVLLSTHSIPADLLKRFLPDSKIKIIGIQPKNIDFGEELSEELENKIEEIIEKVTLFLKQ